MGNNSKPPGALKRWHGNAEDPKNGFAGYSEERGSGRKWVNDKEDRSQRRKPLNE
jgi:hypothetical protein